MTPKTHGVLFAILTVAFPGWCVPATADWSAALPVLTTCNPATPPKLPDRWRAVGLMMPLLDGELDVGEFVYDSTLPAMRATVYGLESGAADLLITNDATYLLEGPHDSPRRCVSLGRKLRPPESQWLERDARCVGEAPLAERQVQWWQVSGFDPARYWFTTDTHLPWRSSFVRRSLNPAIIGDYAMTYFPTFTALPETDLPALRDMCAASAEHQDTDSPTPTARDLMRFANPDALAEREQRIAQLIPGLSHGACPRMHPARWPDRFVATAMVTPIQMTEAPYSSMMYYDWNDAHALVVLPFQGNPPVLQGLISLREHVGYRQRFAGRGVCAAVLPGAVKPDWMTAASCKCRAVVEGNSPLSPGTDSQILSCPIKLQGQRVMWNWYTSAERPVMFMEAQPEGGGVMLADYHDWLPGQAVPSKNFDLPNACMTTRSDAGASFSNPSCSDCHSTPW
jgi:hypothetical protein